MSAIAEVSNVNSLTNAGHIEVGNIVVKLRRRLLTGEGGRKERGREREGERGRDGGRKGGRKRGEREERVEGEKGKGRGRKERRERGREIIYIQITMS